MLPKRCSSYLILSAIIFSIITGCRLEKNHFSPETPMKPRALSYACGESSEALKEATVHLKARRFKESLRELASVSHENLPSLACQRTYHELLARVYKTEGHQLAAVYEYMHLTRLSENTRDIDTYSKTLWKTLNRVPLAEINAAQIEKTPNQILNGWIDLAVIAKKGNASSLALLNDISKWENQYPKHPAIYSVIHKKNNFPEKAPKHIALLLPLSGPLEGPGKAVLDGFLSEMPSEFQIKTYDTAGKSAALLYEEAIANGAEWVVGPLLRQDAESIAKLKHPVPTLLLNEASSEDAPHLWHFGLKPVREAERIAFEARKQHFSRALIIAPQNHWGEEISHAFSDSFERREGKIIDRLYYDDKSDLKEAFRTFLKATDEKFTKKRDKTEPPPMLSELRRTDFDMIFLLAYPSKARQIMPLLRYYFVNDVPVFATSAVYSGTPNRLSDRDLEGILFCDLPSVFTHPMPSRSWPEQLNSYTRLYALGRDSFHALLHLPSFLIFSDMSLDISEDGVYTIHHEEIAPRLVFAKFHQGIAKPLSAEIRERYTLRE